MSVFKSNNTFSKSLHDSICNAFSLSLESGSFEVLTYPWGNVVNIFEGVNIGKYDISLIDGSYVFVEV
jgi:hypothetical protein